MKQKKLLTLTFSQLKQIFNQELPELVEIAEKSKCKQFLLFHKRSISNALNY